MTSQHKELAFPKCGNGARHKALSVPPFHFFTERNEMKPEKKKKREMKNKLEKSAAMLMVHNLISVTQWEAIMQEIEKKL